MIFSQMGGGDLGYKVAESNPIYHSEHCEESQKKLQNRNFSHPTLPQNDNLRKNAESSDFGILHLATKYLSSHTPNDIKDLIEANITFGSEILESALVFKPKFFINILTFSQFANSTSYNPATFYDATKQAFYNITQLYKDAFLESKFINILLYNTYGAGDTRGKFLNLWHEIALNGKSLEMSEGAQKIDISHISDVVCALDLAIENYGRLDSAKTYTLENHPRYTLKEIAEIFEHATNRKLNILWGSKPYRKNEIFNPIAESNENNADSAKGAESTRFAESSAESSDFVRLPGYAPKITLKDGIRQTFA